MFVCVCVCVWEGGGGVCGSEQSAIYSYFQSFLALSVVLAQYHCRGDILKANHTDITNSLAENTPAGERGQAAYTHTCIHTLTCLTTVSSN